MARAATLVPSRMSDRALYDRAFSIAVQLSRYGFVAIKPSEVRAMASELQHILAEQKLRGTQLSLASELRRGE